MAGARLPQPLERASSKVANHAFTRSRSPLIRGDPDRDPAAVRHRGRAR